jgi:hypothetical protein
MELESRASRPLTREHTRPKDLMEIMVTKMGKLRTIQQARCSYSLPVGQAKGKSGESVVQRA